jgi:D-alanyl-D-alanine endopeptidase (penicillin-binding protein 7)
MNVLFFLFVKEKFSRKSFFYFCFSIFLLGGFFLFSSPTVFSQEKDSSLLAIYKTRVDLQNIFDEKTWNTKSDKAGFLIDLIDWAKQYGWQEYPKLLSAYRPKSETSLQFIKNNPAPKVTAQSYLILDRHSEIVLAEKNSTKVWPIASLTKLMTSFLVLDEGTSLTNPQPILSQDEVGGARLSVSVGTKFSVNDLLYAALVGSANNAARALSHSTQLSTQTFIETMNKTAQLIGMPHTNFVESSGIEPQNVSTAREMGRLALHVFSHPQMRRYTTTSTKKITSTNTKIEKKLTNTNWMLWKPEFDDVYITSSKTGYLEESGWNLIVSLRPNATSSDQELLLVLFGSQSRQESFKDAQALAEWVWENFASFPVQAQEPK